MVAHRFCCYDTSPSRMDGHRPSLDEVVRIILNKILGHGPEFSGLELNIEFIEL